MTSTDQLTLKQENFARFYVELGNATAAYKRAYDAEGMQDTTIHVKASELLANGKVRVRVDELQAELAARHEITVDTLVEELDEARVKAMADDKGASAAVGAILGKAKLLGFLTDKHEVSGKDGTPLMADPPNTRDMARAVIAILNTAKLEDAPDEADADDAVTGLDNENTLAAAQARASPAVAQEGEASAVHISGAPDASSDKNDAPDEPDERTVFDNGAQVVWDAERGKWLVFDAFGTMHGMRRNRSDAETHAESLPGPGLRDGGNGDRLID